MQIDAPNAIAGVILGVETRKKEVGKDHETIEVEFLNLLTDEGLRSVPLDSVSRIKLVNEKLDAELRKALAVLATGHDTDKKTVSLNLLGKGKRPVRVGYIQETPIWKTSYRLVLSDKEAALPARLGDRGKHDRRRLERRRPDAGQRPADLVHDGPLRAALRPAAGGRIEAVSPRCGRRPTGRIWHEDEGDSAQLAATRRQTRWRSSGRPRCKPACWRRNGRQRRSAAAAAAPAARRRRLC